jgi:hypothetical protein
MKKTVNKIDKIVNFNFQVCVDLSLSIQKNGMFEHRKFLLYIGIFSPWEPVAKSRATLTIASLSLGNAVSQLCSLL